MEKTFRRKLYNELLYWKQVSNGSTAAIIEGARRVGKTTVVKEFVKNEYEFSLLIDFAFIDPKTKTLFEKGLEGKVDKFLADLQMFENVNLVPRKSVIVFDEVQKCPKAREMIKYLVADGRFDYIETGTLISLRENVRNIMIPSEEYPIDMFPMDFEEYLWAKDNGNLIPTIREKFEKREPLDDLTHHYILDIYREYMLVGGMPQVVDAFIKTGDYRKVDSEKRAVIRLYREDIRKITTKENLKIERIFDMIPSLLSRTSRLFSPSEIKENSRTRSYYDSINWLCEAKIVNQCIASLDPSVALLLSLDDTKFKLYLLDTGLLAAMSLQDSKESNMQIYKDFVLGKLPLNEGMYFENMVAQELRKSYRYLVFSLFHVKDKVRPYEVDFLIEKNGKVIPIECKSSHSSRHKSLDVFMDRYKDIVNEAYVIHNGNLKVEGKITYLPIYMAQFL